MGVDKKHLCSAQPLLSVQSIVWDSDGENQVRGHRAYLVQTPLLISTDIRYHPELCQGYGLSTNQEGLALLMP